MFFTAEPLNWWQFIIVLVGSLAIGLSMFLGIYCMWYMWLKQFFCKHLWKNMGYAALYEYDRYLCVKCDKTKTFSMFNPPKDIVC